MYCGLQIAAKWVLAQVLFLHPLHPQLLVSKMVARLYKLTLKLNIYKKHGKEEDTKVTDKMMYYVLDYRKILFY